MMTKLDQWLNNGKKRPLYLAFLLGVGVTLAMPPIFISPLLWVSFPLLLWLGERAKQQKTRWWIGWWFGLGHFSTGLYWITISLFTDLSQFGWLVPLSVPAIASALACYTGLVMLVSFVFPLKPLGRVLWFAVCWLVGEYLRSYLFTGFPWILIGYVWSWSSWIEQSAAWFGIYGLGLLTLIIVSLPFCSFYASNRLNRTKPVILSLALILSVAAIGAMRLIDSPIEMVSGVKLRLVQANISQHEKWHSDQQRRFNTIEKHIALTNQPGIEAITHIVWSESSIPYVLYPGSEIIQYITKNITPNAMLITGAVRGDVFDPNKIWNSMFALSFGDRQVDYYDKVHLVPFGEYIPFRKFIPFKKITHGSTDFLSGPKGKTLDLKGLGHLIPLICYEGIFPPLSSQQNTEIKGLINITNDAWFGHSTGPYQHFNMVRMRAIEQGLPMIRVANTGISALIDPYGRIIKELPLGTQGVIDSEFPKALVNKTIYSQWGEYTVLLMICITGFFTLLCCRPNREQE